MSIDRYPLNVFKKYVYENHISFDGMDSNWGEPVYVKDYLKTHQTKKK